MKHSEAIQREKRVLAKENRKFVLFWIGLFLWIVWGAGSLAMSLISCITYLVTGTSRSANTGSISALFLCAFVIATAIKWISQNAEQNQYD